MDERNNNFDFDFKPIGQAIKKARLAKGMTRDDLARIVDYDPRHLQAIENEGSIQALNCLFSLSRCLIFRWTNIYIQVKKRRKALSADA